MDPCGNCVYGIHMDGNGERILSEAANENRDGDHFK
jgi:hypothetical protein